MNSPYTTPSDTVSMPVHIGTGTPVARDEDQHRSTMPMPTFARRPPTMSSFLPVDIPQNSMAGQQRQQISELQFDKFPRPQSFLVARRMGSPRQAKNRRRQTLESPELACVQTNT